MILAMTGHRPQKLQLQDAERTADVEQRVRGVIRWALETLKVQRLISGMALGVDQWAAEEAMQLRVPIIAAIPCLEQEKFWSVPAKGRYLDLLGKVEQKIYVSERPYSKGCMQQRNVWMVDRCNAVLAIFDGTPGGTANAVTYAVQCRRPVLRYHPFTAQSEWLK